MPTHLLFCFSTVLQALSVHLTALTEARFVCADTCAASDLLSERVSLRYWKENTQYNAHGGNAPLASG